MRGCTKSTAPIPADPRHAANMASSCLGEYGAAGYCQGAMAERELPEKGLPHSTCCLYVVRIDFVRANHVWTWRKGRRIHDLGSCAHRRQQLHCVQLWNVYLLCRYMQIGPALIVHMGGYSLCLCHYEPQLSEFLLVLAFLGRLNGFKYAFTTH